MHRWGTGDSKHRKFFQKFVNRDRMVTEEECKIGRGYFRKGDYNKWDYYVDENDSFGSKKLLRQGRDEIIEGTKSRTEVGGFMFD